MNVYRLRRDLLAIPDWVNPHSGYSRSCPRSLREEVANLLRSYALFDGQTVRPCVLYACFVDFVLRSIKRLTWDFNFAFLPYGPEWRACRKMFHQHFQPDVVRKYRPIQLRQARALLGWILGSPRDTAHHIRRYVGSSALVPLWAMAHTLSTNSGWGSLQLFW